MDSDCFSVYAVISYFRYKGSPSQTPSPPSLLVLAALSVTFRFNKNVWWRLHYIAQIIYGHKNVWTTTTIIYAWK